VLFIATASDPRSTSRPVRPTDSQINWRPASSAGEESDSDNHDDDDDVNDDEWSQADKNWVRDGQQLQSDSNKMKREQGYSTPHVYII